MHYFPSKKVAVVAVFALGVLTWVVFDSNSFVNMKYDAETPSVVSTDPSTSPDSDNDGLFDWQEKLLGTNPYNFDSDNNGVSDGEQHSSAKQVPLVTPTDNVLNYLSQLGNAVANGGGIPQPPEPKLTNKPDVYGKDLYTLLPPTRDMYEEYALALTNILRFSYPDITGSNILGTISMWVETGNEGEREKIEKHADMLTFASADLSQLSIPSDLIEMHLELINNLHKEALALEELLKTTRSNPGQGFLSSADYTNYRSKRSEVIITLTDILYTRI